MLFTSPVDPNVRSSQELIVLRHGERGILVPLPDTYDDTIQVAQREFSLEGSIHLTTSDIPACIGKNVIIHRDAWKGISTLLTNVHVSLADQKPQAARRASRASSSRIMGVAPPAEALFASAERRKSRLSSSALAMSRGAPRKSGLSGAGPSNPASSSLARLSNGKQKDFAGDMSYVTNIEDDDEDEVDDIVQPSPSKRKAQRARACLSSDSEEDEIEIDGELAKPGVQAVEDAVSTGSTMRQTNFTSEPDEDTAGADPLVEQKPDLKPPPFSFPDPEIPRQPAPTPSPAQRSLVMSNVRRSSLAHQRLSLRKEEPIKIKKEPQYQSRAAAAGSASSQLTENVTQSPRPRGGDLNDRFVISIEFDNGVEGNQTLFKTRGGHLVSKVLLQACKTFGIEEYYDMASLVLLLNEVAEDDTVVVQRYFCSPEDTMSMVGAVPDSAFAVELDLDDEDD